MKTIPRLWLEKYLLGEASDAERAAVEALPNHKALLSALEEENQAFLRHHPSWTVLPRIRARQEFTASRHRPRRTARSGTLPGRLAGAFAGLGLALVLVLGGLPVLLGPDADEGTRAKGASSPLTIWVQRGGTSVALDDGAPVTAWESLQIAYRVPRDSWGMVFSIDGRGRMTLHHPEDYTSEARLSADGLRILPYAYQLDDAPAFEAFYLVRSTVPTGTADLWSLLEASLAHPQPSPPSPTELLRLLGRDWQVSRLVLYKETTP